MADIVDIAGEYTEQMLADATKSLQTKLHARGRCLYCGAKVVGVFCAPEDDDCRDSWERSQRLKRINGR